MFCCWIDVPLVLFDRGIEEWSIQTGSNLSRDRAPASRDLSRRLVATPALPSASCLPRLTPSRGAQHRRALSSAAGDDEFGVYAVHVWDLRGQVPKILLVQGRIYTLPSFCICPCAHACAVPLCVNRDSFPFFISLRLLTLSRGRARARALCGCQGAFRSLPRVGDCQARGTDIWPAYRLIDNHGVPVDASKPKPHEAWTSRADPARLNDDAPAVGPDFLDARVKDASRSTRTRVKRRRTVAQQLQWTMRTWSTGNAARLGL